MTAVSTVVHNSGNVISHDQLWDLLKESMEEEVVDGERANIAFSIENLLCSFGYILAHQAIQMTADGILWNFFGHDAKECQEALQEDDNEKYDSIIEGAIDFWSQNETFMHTLHDMHTVAVDESNLIDLFLLDCMEVLQRNNVFYTQEYGGHVYHVVNSPLVEVW